MRILLLTDSFPPHAGGSREYYNNIYQKLIALGKSEVVVLTKKVPGWKEFDRVNSSWAYRIHRRFKPLNSWKYQELPKAIFPFLQTLWHLLVDRPDIIHAGDLYPQGLVAMIVRKIWRIPYLAYCHGEEITQTDRFRFQPKVRDRIYRNADAVVANSEFARQNLLRIGVADERIFKITPGVDAVRFKARPPRLELVERFGLKDKLVVLTVARLVPRKGHRVAIEAFARICGEFPNAHYLIVGTGPEELRLRSQVDEAGIANRVTFAGFISGEELTDIYSLGDIMLLANRQEENGDIEGFGIVFLEANAAGKPVIGGRSGGAVEAVVEGVTGHLVNPDDPEELSAILRRLLQDPALRTTLGSAGADRVRDEFNWSTRAEKLDQINRRLLNSKTSQARVRTGVATSAQKFSSDPMGADRETTIDAKQQASADLNGRGSVLRVDQRR
jgi:phosphatidylinositol alpha-1,6-mannosyltransferase